MKHHSTFIHNFKLDIEVEVVEAPIKLLLKTFGPSINVSNNILEFFIIIQHPFGMTSLWYPVYITLSCGRYVDKSKDVHYIYTT